ncbi:hypothetical protein Egran_01040 [Elaphomyces granulatus]|uniref:Uncharacterized protein n=1 Tax=Elaphomyces granulatus TaxID=519963 RepID=A0A232M4D2_9EURO|nr:hypothetical protein Egran_01040 [Elaphomyces granulatus]
MAIVEEGGAGDASLQPECSSKTEVLPGTISADGSRPDEVAIEATTVDTTQSKKKKKKRKRKNNTSLDDDNLHPRKSARNDAESTPRMELEEAAVRAPDGDGAGDASFQPEQALPAGRPDEVAIEATVDNTHSSPQPKKKKKKRKRSNAALDDDNLHPRKSARNDAEPTPRMELEEAAVRAPDGDGAGDASFQPEHSLTAEALPAGRPDEVAIEATVDNTHSSPQPKKKKKKRKRSNTALDDDNLHPRKSVRNDAEPTPRMELEEAAVRAPDGDGSGDASFQQEHSLIAEALPATISTDGGRPNEVAIEATVDNTHSSPQPKKKKKKKRKRSNTALDDDNLHPRNDAEPTPRMEMEEAAVQAPDEDGAGDASFQQEHSLTAEALPATLSTDGGRPNEVAIEATVDTHSSTQSKRKKKKKKKKNTSLDDARKSAPNDAHPGMEVEEAAVRAPDEDGAGDVLFQPEHSLTAEALFAEPSTDGGPPAIETTVDTHSAPQLKRKKSDASLDDNLNPRKSARNDAEPTPRMELEEAAVRAPNMKAYTVSESREDGAEDALFQPVEPSLTAEELSAKPSIDDDPAIEATVDTQSSPQLKRKRSDASLDDDVRNDAHLEMEVEEAAGRVLDVRINSWTGEHVIKDINTVNSRLSASEKQTIIASLDGYCKQEDWESLIKRFSTGVREVIPQLFAHAIWTKHLFEDILMKPFYYFDSYDQEEEEKEEDNMASPADKPDGSFSFPTQLQKMYEMFKQVDEAQAYIWRCNTIRLANSVVSDNQNMIKLFHSNVARPVGQEIKDYSSSSSVLMSTYSQEAKYFPRERSKQARRSTIERLVSRILDGPCMRLLLLRRRDDDIDEPPEEEESNNNDRRYQEIVQIYGEAAEWGVRLWTATFDIHGHGLDQVHTFHHETLDLHPFHFFGRDLKDDDHPRMDMDGQPVLLVIQPPLYIRRNLGILGEFDSMVGKGLVLVEDPGSAASN